MFFLLDCIRPFRRAPRMQPPPKRTRTEAGVRVRLRFNVSAAEAQDARDEEGDAS